MAPKFKNNFCVGEIRDPLHLGICSTASIVDHLLGSWLRRHAKPSHTWRNNDPQWLNTGICTTHSLHLARGTSQLPGRATALFIHLHTLLSLGSQC